MKNKNYYIARTPADLGQLLGLSDSEMALVQYKIKLKKLAAKAIKDNCNAKGCIAYDYRKK